MPLIDCTADLMEEAIASQPELESGSISSMRLAHANTCYGLEIALSTGNACMTSTSDQGQERFGRS